MGNPYNVTQHDPRTDSEEVVAERIAFAHILQEEVLPGEPPTPLDQAVASIRAIPERMRMWSFRARDLDGRLVASGGTSVDPEDETNRDIFWVSLHVLPEHRRQGIGTRLLAELVKLAPAEGRVRLIGSTNERVAGGAAFAEAVGGAPKAAEHLNHLPLAEVDRPLLEGWVAEGPKRAGGYDLVAVDGRIPDDLAEAFVDLVLVMNTAPRDDLDVEDFTFSVRELREGEARSDAAGLETWTVIARHRDTGELAGFHDVTWNPANPAVVWVGATGVKPEHRGHALGKWLKAALTLRVIDERPDVTEIRTGNADSNDAMLGINKAMGYRPMHAHTVWEVSVEEAARWLAARDQATPAPA